MMLCDPRATLNTMDTAIVRTIESGRLGNLNSFRITSAYRQTDAPVALITWSPLYCGILTLGERSHGPDTLELTAYPRRPDAVIEHRLASPAVLHLPR